MATLNYNGTYTIMTGGYYCSCGVFVRPGQSHTCEQSDKYIVSIDHDAHAKLDELLRIVRDNKNRTCSVCGSDSPCWTDMPFGSTHDGEIICGDCCHKYIDPILDLVRNAREGK